MASREAEPGRLRIQHLGGHPSVRRRRSGRAREGRQRAGGATRVAAHDVACVDAEPVQIVASALHVPVRVRTLSGPIEAAREEARRQAAGDAAAPFDLERGPLLRVALLQLADAEFVIVVSTHHIVSDGWSMNVFFRELTLLYAAFASGCPSPLPDLPIQYADYAVWQQESLGTGLTDRLGYWQRELADAPLLHLVPTDFSRPRSRPIEGGAREFSSTRISPPRFSR